MMDLTWDDEWFFAPLTLASVNVAWRNAALRTPTVWSKLALYVDPTDSDPSHPAIPNRSIAQTWIERSGVTPLYQRVKWCVAYELVLPPDEERMRWAKLIASLSHRLVHLDLCVDGWNAWGCIPREEYSVLVRNAFPILESLVLNLCPQLPSSQQHKFTDSIAIKKLSRLRHFTAVGAIDKLLTQMQLFEGTMSLESLTLQVQALPGVHDRGNGFMTCLNFWLSPSTRISLRFLKLDIPRSFLSKEKPLAVPLTLALPNLQELHISRSFATCCLFFSTFSVPALTTLHVRGTWSTPDKTANVGKGTLSVVLENVRLPSLRTLNLEYVTGVDDQLRQFLLAHPELVSLRLIAVPITKKTIVTLTKYPKRTRQPAPCPRLERIDIDDLDKIPQLHARLQSWLDDVLTARYTEAQPAESYREEARKFTRLVSLKWLGEEKLPLQT